VSSVGSKRKAVYGSLLSPAAKAARTGGGAHAAGGGRPEYDSGMVAKEACFRYRWEWRTIDGTYEAFDEEQCIAIETCWRKKEGLARVWGRRFPVGHDENLKCMIDFEDMTASIVGSEWVTAVRRWNVHDKMGDSWDHQEDNVSIVEVEAGWRDYKVVETAFFGRKRRDGKTPRLSPRTHRIVKVRRIQNRRHLDLFEAERKHMQRKRGDTRVELTRTYAWHGSGKVRPDSIAAGNGFMMQYGNSEGFYLQGTYTAEQASYSHHERYVYRSSDVEGEEQDDTGKYFHLLLVDVLRGEPLQTSEVWRGQGIQSVVEGKLGRQYDSVEGGPHRPTRAGPGEDDSEIYVVYHASQVLPEFIVTYTEAGAEVGGRVIPR